jgi:hypothetical protein
MVRIEMLTDVKDPPGYLKGEVRMVSPETAGYLCGLGWARALDGKLQTGKPDLSPKRLTLADGTHSHKPSNPGVK